MPETTDAPRTTDAPDGAGLPQGGRPDAPPARGGVQLIDAAAEGLNLTPGESDDLVAFFVSNGEMPGDKAPLPLELKLGHGSAAKTFKCAIKPITWSEWQDARKRATNETTGDFDPYVSSSWVVARSLVKPILGPTVLRMLDEAKEAEDDKIAGPGGKRIDPPTDSAELLRRMFEKQSGVLLELSGKVLDISKLQGDNQSVKEVEAGKL